MKAVHFPGNRRTELREARDPKPGPDEVVLEVRASGMCGSDLHTYRSEAGAPFVIGHEPCVMEERSELFRRTACRTRSSSTTARPGATRRAGS